MKKRLLQISLLAAAGWFMLGSSGPMCPEKEPPSGTRPEIIYVYPNDGDTNVRLNQTIIFTFTKPMNTALTERALRIIPALTGTFTWNAEHTSFTFHPDPDMQPNTIYMATVGTAAESQDGWELASQRGATWTTGP